ncbi:MAG: class I SAM-dependent methyltransferase [Synechococcus sp.]|nr:class I SAM-dependent methyltransferase [Synechococcus sp.]
MTNKFTCYDDQFYLAHNQASYQSALKYIEHLFKFYLPKSVIDVGCGRGAWLLACQNKGATELTGIDGTWNSQDKMLSQTIKFRPINLSDPPPNSNERYDLAMSLEVAEHLPQSQADSFTEYLTKLADQILFSAAYTNQGGDNHLNEQPHSYWAQKFLARGYVPYDLFRPVFWGDDSIDYCYQQNAYLYVKKNSFLIAKLAELGYKPITNIYFMDCIHPRLYEQQGKLRTFAAKRLEKFLPGQIKYRLKKILRGG